MTGWKPGDRVYCVKGSMLTRPTLETGKVYRVADVIPMPSMPDVGLVLEGVALPDGHEGVWSNRFVRLDEMRTRRPCLD